MTDSELVERVAREVMEYKEIEIAGLNHTILHRLDIDTWATWVPLIDMNDLLMVLSKFERWEVSRDWTEFTCVIWANQRQFSAVGKETATHAVLEAALKAVEKG